MMNDELKTLDRTSESQIMKYVLRYVRFDYDNYMNYTYNTHNPI